LTTIGAFLHPCPASACDQQRIHYIRFANTKNLLFPEFSGQAVEMHELNANQGFESFASQVYQLITEAGRKVF